MVKTLNELATYADLVLPGEGEGKILCGSEDAHKINDFYQSLGAKMVVTKLGPKGALVRNGDQESTVPGFIIDKVVDTVGAGDGFACGVLKSRQLSAAAQSVLFSAPSQATTKACQPQSC